MQIFTRSSDVCGELTDELPDIGNDPWFGDLPNVPIGKASILSNENPIDSFIEWCNKEYEPVREFTFTDEMNDPDKNVMTLTGTIDLCKRFRHTLKSFRL